MIRRTVSLVASYHLMPPPPMKRQEVKCSSYFWVCAWCLMDLPVFYCLPTEAWDWQLMDCGSLRHIQSVKANRCVCVCVCGEGGLWWRGAGQRGRTLMEKTFLKNLEDKAVSPTLCLQPIRRLLQPDESLIEEHRREGGWFNFFLISFLRSWGGVQQQIWKRCCLALKLQPSTPVASSASQSWAAGKLTVRENLPGSSALLGRSPSASSANPETFAANHVVHFQIQVSKPRKQTQRRSNLAP